MIDSDWRHYYKSQSDLRVYSQVGVLSKFSDLIYVWFLIFVQPINIYYNTHIPVLIKKNKCLTLTNKGNNKITKHSNLPKGNSKLINQ